MTHTIHGLRTIGLTLLLAGCVHASSTLPIATPSLQAPTSTAQAPSPPGKPTSSATPAPSPASAILAGEVDRSTLDLTATYDVDLDVVVGSGAITVTTDLEIRNDSGVGIDRLELNTIAARLGGLTVTHATVDDRPVSVTIDDQTLNVPLGGILPDGASASIRLGYSATLRRGLDGSDWLFSRTGGTVALYRWIPWVSRAVPFDRPNHGDPFVTPSSPRVRVLVTTDVPMILASPGAGPVQDGLEWSFEARDVREVAMVMAPDFTVSTGDAGGTPVRAYVRPGGLDGDRLVEQASRALARIADRLGVPYPWPAFTVVETAGGYGMESPGLIWIPAGVAPANLAYLLHHETAHQWFYGLVGNDQRAEPFADEAAADLLARTVLGALRGSRCDRAPLDRSIDAYSDACYYEVVYIQGGNVLDDLREVMGTERFWAAMGGYLEANRFGLGGTRELLEVLRAASEVDLMPILSQRFPDLY